MIKLFLAGDVMTGRGIDQILPFPVEPQIYEPYMKSARGYVELAEQAHGRLPRLSDFSYIWGDALKVLGEQDADIKLINLETAITTSREYYQKGINYRMNPRNVPCLAAAGIDCCVLANNHVLDWEIKGLEETLETLARAGIKTAGAGRDRAEAQAPAVLDRGGKGRVLVFAFGCADSGIPPDWAAQEYRPGVNLLADLSEKTARKIGESVRREKRKKDIAVASIHWGSNWGYEIPPQHREFARALIDQAEVDLIHGHSSHHVKAIEVHHGKPILYGCGDLLNDYEGISGHEEFRPDLGAMYFACFAPVFCKLAYLTMIPTLVRRLRIKSAPLIEAGRLRELLNREGAGFGTSVETEHNGIFSLKWQATNGQGAE